MEMSAISSVNVNSLVGQNAASSAAGMKALKEAMNVQQLEQLGLIQMMRELSPHLGQNVDVMA